LVGQRGFDREARALALGTGMRGIPPVNSILSQPALQGLHDVPREAIVAACRQVLESVRSRLEAGEGPAPAAAAIAEECAALARAMARATPSPVINATGVVIHTNLGRSPLAVQAILAMEKASGYCDLEIDLATGERGSRQAHVEELVARVTGAEAALACNNNAGAVLLVLSALAGGREVIVSRGELVEIGGSFRVPEIMEQSGARLVETGTTNRTRLVDYERAITTETAVILKVHPSNYRMVGFVESVTHRDLQALAHSRGIPVVYDCGSGLLVRLPGVDLGDEPLIPEIVSSGCDVVTFSGDKLLGGPQTGIIAGRAALLARLKRHPLARALRPDKTTLAALSATLRIYAFGRPLEDIPVLEMLLRPSEKLERMARSLAGLLQEAVPGGRYAVLEGESCPGGGSCPGLWLKSWLVSVEIAGQDASTLSGCLRQGSPPVIARVHEGRLVMDVRTVSEDELPRIAACLADLKMPC
jgi:L-seryl-tRNA(Ser) seleniumtransferase